MTCSKCKKDIPEDAAYCPYCGKKINGRRPSYRRVNGQGSVYKLSGRRRRPWAAVKDGQYIGYYETKTEALAAVNRLSGETISEKINYTFTHVYEGWKQEHFQEVGESGEMQYRLAYEYFQEIHGKKFRDLRTADFQTILDRGKDQSVSTVSKRKQLLTQMSEWAIREQICSVNFAHYCTVRGRESVSHIPMEQEDVDKLYKAAETDETAKIVCCLLSTGMRIGELFRLRMADYYGSYVIGGEKTDAGRNRVIPIRPEGREHFAYFARLAEGKELWIDGYTGNHDPANFRKREYYKLLDRLGIDRAKTPHSTRVTYTTQAVAEKMAPADLQKILGHSDFNTTQKHYNHPDAGRLVQAVEDAAEKKPGA